jgi:hypothetical protein
VTCFNVALAALRILYTKGVLSHVYGSFLHTRLWPRTHGRQEVPPKQQLAYMFEQIQHMYIRLSVEDRLTNLHLSMICNIDSPHASFPYFKTKGGETRHLLPITCELARELNNGTAHDRHMEQCLCCFCCYDTLLDENGMFVTDDVADAAEECMLDALGHYLWLHQWAKDEQRNLWHVVPKFHMAYHMSEHKRYLNPRHTWTFKGEDYVGKMSTMAHSCTFGLKRTKLSGKFCQKYVFCLHHRLTRGDFS